jgi:hypothetical protein
MIHSVPSCSVRDRRRQTFRVRIDPNDKCVNSLVAATDALTELAATDTRAVAVGVRACLLAAHRCGLAVAADRSWRARRANAAAVEYVLVDRLARITVLDDDVDPPIEVDPIEVDEVLTGPEADRAVVAIHTACTVAGSLLRAAAARTPIWGAVTACLDAAVLFRELGECWDGRHPSYAHRPDSPRR